MVVGGVCEKFSCLSGVAHELYHELVPPRSSNRKSGNSSSHKLACESVWSLTSQSLTDCRLLKDTDWDLY